VIVGRAADGNLGDGGMGEEDILDLSRVDVLRTPDDHVLQSPLDAQAAAIVHRGEVARVVPAVPVDRRCEVKSRLLS